MRICIFMVLMIDISAFDMCQCHWNSTGNWVTEYVHYMKYVMLHKTSQPISTLKVLSIRANLWSIICIGVFLLCAVIQIQRQLRVLCLEKWFQSAVLLQLVFVQLVWLKSSWIWWAQTMMLIKGFHFYIPTTSKEWTLQK